MSGGDEEAHGRVVHLTHKPRKCPVCGKPAQKAHRPFCSRRCADLDLGRWLGERYRIAGEPAAQSDGGDEGEET